MVAHHLRLLNMTLSWNWDKWQEDVLNHEGNLTLRTGRQVGKSEVVSAKAEKFAREHPGTTTMIIAASQRQSSLLFEKVRARIDLNILKDPNYELAYDNVQKPTLTRITFTNGSKIYSLPTGRTGHFIRGFTIDLLIADEAAYIPESVWTAVTPMMAVSRKERGLGWTILLSTPFGKGGYFFESFKDKDFKAIHVSSEDCKRIPKAFLKKEKQRMTKAEYRQEYQGEFTDEWNQFFTTDLIKDRMTFIEWSKNTDKLPDSNFYLGVDIARYGGDENAFVIAELSKDNRIKIVKCITTERVSTTDTIGRIHDIDSQYNFKKIFIDDGGIGGAVLDALQVRMGRRIIGLNNASKSIKIKEDEKKKGILKEDLYSNALMLMETKRIELINDRQLMRSLKGMTFQYGDENKKNSRNIHIFGDYSHLAEAFVRACWCIKEKGLDLYVY